MRKYYQETVVHLEDGKICRIKSELSDLESALNLLDKQIATAQKHRIESITTNRVYIEATI